MRRLLLAAFLFPSGAPVAAAPAPSFARQESAVKAAAQAYAADVCKQAPASCDEAKKLLGDYLNALSAATKCDAGGCKLDAIKDQAKALAELDRRQGALPVAPAGRADRPLLSLSAIASSRLTAAATRLGDRYGASFYGPDDQTELQKVVEAYCLDAKASCAEMRGLPKIADDARSKLAACAGTCTLEQVDPIIETAKSALSDYLRLSNLSKVDTVKVFSSVNAAGDQGIAAYTPLADQAAADLEKSSDELGAKLDLAEKDASAPMTGVDAAGRDLFERQQRAALAADRLAYHLSYDPKTGSPARRERINADEIKLSGLRARALALRTARGLGEDKDAAGAVAVSGAAGAGVTPAAGAVPLSVSPKTILDKRMVPGVGGGAGGAPPIVPGNPSMAQLLKNSLSKDPVIRTDALRRLGVTSTLGDPDKYAPQAFTQESNDTCAIAAQVQALRAHGLLDTKVDPKIQEKALAEEARKAGYFKTGTPPAYVGSLLTDHGMLVEKKRDAPWSDFEDSLRRGGLIQARVDAAKLWKIGGSKALSHSILVTGAEVSKINGKILGVYINDSGINPPGAGEFIDVDAFKKAFTGDYVEVR